MAEGIGFTQDAVFSLRPSTLGTLRAWYDASQESFADGDAVGTFTDRSGNARHSTQATGANKPLFKTGVANGHPALLFDGSNDYLATASFGATTQPTTVYIVAQRTASTSATRVLADGIGVSNRLFIQSAITTGFPGIYAGTDLGGFEDIGSDWFLLTAIFDGSSSKLFVNDVLVATGAAGAQTLTGITLGASYLGASPWGGYIAEAIYFDGAVTTDNDYTIRRALQAKYKIPYFDPSSVTGLVSKFMADSLRLRDSEAVSEWEDTISGYNVLQATAANQPLLIRDELNHHPVVRFDGSNDYLRSAAFTALTQPRTIFAVAKNTSNAAIRTLLDGIVSGNRHTIFYQTSGNLWVFGGTALDSGTNVGLGWNIITVQYNGGTTIVRRNGTQLVSGAGGSHTLTGYTIGAVYDNSSPFIGDHYALLNYNGALSTVNMQKIEGWLRTLTAL